MATVYVLYSAEIDRFYIGSCMDFKQRIAQHKNKTFEKSFTAQANDWEVFIQFHELGYPQARAIEAHIKRMKSRKYLYNLKNYPEMIAKLKSKYAG